MNSEIRHDFARNQKSYRPGDVDSKDPKCEGGVCNLLYSSLCCLRRR